MYRVISYILASALILVNMSLVVMSIFWLPSALGIAMGLTGTGLLLWMLYWGEKETERRARWNQQQIESMHYWVERDEFGRIEDPRNPPLTKGTSLRDRINK